MQKEQVTTATAIAANATVEMRIAVPSNAEVCCHWLRLMLAGCRPPARAVAVKGESIARCIQEIHNYQTIIHYRLRTENRQRKAHC